MSLWEKNQYFSNKQKNVSALKSLQSNSGDLTVVRIQQNQKCKKETKKNQSTIICSNYENQKVFKKFKVRNGTNQIKSSKSRRK